MSAGGDRRPLGVCLVTTELRTGGAERCLTRLALGLDRSRFAPWVVSLMPRPTCEAPLLDALEAEGVDVAFLDLRRGWQAPAAVSRLRRLLVERLRSHGPQLVQSFLFHANLLALRAAPRDLPVLTGVRVADPRRWRLWLERLASRRAKHIVCVSRSVAEHCRRHRFPAARLEVIPNGIECDKFPAPAVFPVDWPDGRRMLLFVGRLHPQKGLDWLWPLLPEILARLPEHDLALAGAGPEESSLRSEAERLGISTRVHFLGQQRDVAPLLSAADLLLLPSRWEGMPNALLEAMASAKPVAATRAEGVLELLGEPLSRQQTVPFGDDTAWIELVTELAGDPARSAALGRANRDRVVAEFSVETMLARYAALFEG